MTKKTPGTAEVKKKSSLGKNVENNKNSRIVYEDA